MQNNTYKETFNVINTSIAQTADLCKLALVLQGGREIWTVNFCLCGSMGNCWWAPDQLMKPAKRKVLMTKNPVCNEKIPPAAAHHSKHRAYNNFQHLLQSARWEMVLKWMTITSQATKEMNPTPTLLIMTVTVVTVKIKCTPDHPKYRALNSLHDLAYCKK